MEPQQAKNSLQKQLNAGATSLVLLALFQQQKRPMYGYEVAKQLESHCHGALPMKPGALYPVLRSLEKQDLLASHVEPSDAGPSRKYYRITDHGKKTLRHWRTAWEDTKQFVDNVLEHQHASAKRKSDQSLPAKTRSRTS